MTPERWQQIKDVLATALEMPPAERLGYLEQSCAGDISLRHEVDLLLLDEPKLSARFLNDTALATVAASILPEEDNPWIGRRVGAYRIVEQIGAGGMGEVYCAFRADDEYRKRVALKVVRAGQESGFVVSRFKNERQILAGLDHPNIARLLDGGTTEDGTPYFVMELIEGQPIGEYCDARQLPISDRLTLFLQVCAAVQYAHQRLIIHRDIKPSNILVTSEGTPKLLDFGIAKILDVNAEAQSDPTLTIFRILTPAYASPEQVKGEPITTASDVYSLGVVLYELLTGSTPYQVTSQAPQEIVRAICEFEPERPSTVLRRTSRESRQGPTQKTRPPADSVRDGSPHRLGKRLRGDLDNIVLMALRKEPQRRYASVEQLAEDIRRHLEHLPVIAGKDTIRYRASKFITRHKTGVFAAAVVVITLLVGMAATVREARIARVQRMKAEQRFKDVRELANSLIFDVHDSIQDLPGATAARKLIVDKALQYLDSLARESQGDASLERELAAAYKRIGDVQGFDFSANLGDNTTALKSYQKALAIRTALWSGNPENVADGAALAESFRLVSQTQLFAGDVSSALDNSQKAVAIVEPLAGSHPDDASIVQELLADYQAVANTLGGDLGLSNMGDNVTAMVFRRKQLDAAQRLANLNPSNVGGQGNLAIAFTTMGDQLWQGGEGRPAMDYYSRARSIFEELAAHSHRQARALYLLGLVCERMATIELSGGNVSQALAAIRKALDISKQLSAADPQDVQSGATLADDYGALADLESRRGNVVAASSDLNQAMTTMAHLVLLSPKNTEILGSQATLYVTAGNVVTRSGNKHQALKYYENAIAILSGVQFQNLRNAGARQCLAATYSKAGRAQEQLKDFDAAGAMFRKALALADPEASAANPNVQALYTVADSYSGLGEVEAALGTTSRLGRKSQMEHWQQAVSWYGRSLEVWGRVKEPGAVSPNGFDCVSPAVVSRRLAQSNAALSRLQAALH